MHGRVGIRQEEGDTCKFLALVTVLWQSGQAYAMRGGCGAAVPLRCCASIARRCCLVADKI